MSQSLRWLWVLDARLMYVGDGKWWMPTTLSEAHSYGVLRRIKSTLKWRCYGQRLPAERREQVARWALAEVGKPYDPFSGLTDTRSQYCSKLIWQLYGRAGVKLSPAQTWILPEQLAQSAALAWVAKWSVSQSVGGNVL